MGAVYERFIEPVYRYRKKYHPVPWTSRPMYKIYIALVLQNVDRQQVINAHV